MAIVKAAQWFTNKKKVKTSHRFYTNRFTTLLSPQHFLCSFPTLKSAIQMAVNMYKIKQKALDVPVSKFRKADIRRGV